MRKISAISLLLKNAVSGPEKENKTITQGIPSRIVNRTASELRARTISDRPCTAASEMAGTSEVARAKVNTLGKVSKVKAVPLSCPNKLVASRAPYPAT